jgi:hypothetical protein
MKKLFMLMLIGGFVMFSCSDTYQEPDFDDALETRGIDPEPWIPNAPGIFCSTNDVVTGEAVRFSLQSEYAVRSANWVTEPATATITPIGNGTSADITFSSPGTYQVKSRVYITQGGWYVPNPSDWGTYTVTVKQSLPKNTIRVNMWRMPGESGTLYLEPISQYPIPFAGSNYQMVYMYFDAHIYQGNVLRETVSLDLNIYTGETHGDVYIFESDVPNFTLTIDPSTVRFESYDNVYRYVYGG